MKKYYEIIRELREDLHSKTSQGEVAKHLGMTQRKLSYIGKH